MAENGLDTKQWLVSKKRYVELPVKVSLNRQLQRAEKRIEARKRGVINREHAVKLAGDALEDAKKRLADERAAADLLRRQIAKKREAAAGRALKAIADNKAVEPPRSSKESDDLLAIHPHSRSPGGVAGTSRQKGAYRRLRCRPGEDFPLRNAGHRL